MEDSTLSLTYGQLNLIRNFEALWLSLALWTRAFANRVSYGVDYTPIFNRLYRVPLDFYNRLQIVFSPEQLEALVNLLRTHISLITNIIVAQKNDDMQTVQTYTPLVYENADAIATLLAQINPFWDVAQWQNLLYNYISLTFEETSAILVDQPERDIVVYDRIINQAYQMGEYMANGIIAYLTARNQPVV